MSDSIDTSIDASAEEVHSAADWLDKVRTGLTDAENGICDSSTYQEEISGEFGDAVKEYAQSLSDACSSASEELDTYIDVISSWGDQITWRKEDMAQCRDKATEGGLTVTGELITAPDPVSSPGDLPKDATAKEKAAWNEENASYEAYVKKQELFEELRGDVQDVRDKLTTWVETNMVVTEGDSFAFEVAMNTLSETGTTLAENGVENVYMGVAYSSLYNQAVPGATERAAAASGNPQRRAGAKPPNPDSVARRANASAASKMGAAARSASRAATAGGVVLGLALSGWEIARGKSPSSVVVENVAGAAAGLAVMGGFALATTAGAPALAVIGTSAVVATAAGWAYEKWVPLRTREKIDEGMRDAWDATTDKAEDAWDWTKDKATSAWTSVFG